MSQRALQPQDGLALLERVLCSLWAIAQLCPADVDDTMPNNIRQLCLLFAERLNAAYAAYDQERSHCTCGQRTVKGDVTHA